MTEKSIAGWQVVITLKGDDALKTIHEVIRPLLRKTKALSRREERPLDEETNKAELERWFCEDMQDLIDEGLAEPCREPDGRGTYRLTELGNQLSEDEAKALFDLLDEKKPGTQIFKQFRRKRGGQRRP